MHMADEGFEHHSKRQRKDLTITDQEAHDLQKALVVSNKTFAASTSRHTTNTVIKTELVPCNDELLSLVINPEYHQRLINSGELDINNSPISRRSPEVRYYDINLDSFWTAMANILYQFLSWKLNQLAYLSTTQIEAELKVMVPIIVDACITALYSKMHVIHRQYGRYSPRFQNPPTYARDIELPLPFADAIQNFGVFEPQNASTNCIYVPVYPEGIENEGRLTKDWNSWQYEAYIPTLKSIGIPVKSVDVRITVGSSWWLYQVKIVQIYFDLVCIFPPSNYSDHSTLVATMFLTLNDANDGVRPIIKYKDDDVAYPTRCREITVGSPLRAFFALCHAPKLEWNSS